MLAAMAYTDKAETRFPRPAAQCLHAAWTSTAHLLEQRPAVPFSLTALALGIVVAALFPDWIVPYLALAFLGGLILAWLEISQRADSPAGNAAELAEAKQRAEDASRAKSRFLAMVSHEVRTPLNGILGMTHLLERTPLTAEQESYVAAVRRSGGALYDLVADLLDFSAIEAGRFEMRSDPVDLHRLVEDATELMAQRAHEKGLDIAASFSAEAPHIITTDENRLRQVLFNLVGNAIKFTETGGIAITVGRSGAMLTIAITDTGPGLAPADRKRIFEEFEQASQGSRRAAGGVGLGLSISSRILAAMGGSIDLECPAEGGSRFIAYLPIPAEDETIGLSRRLAENRVLILTPRVQTGDALATSIAIEGGAAWRAGSEPAEVPAMEGITDIIVDRAFAEPAAFLTGVPSHADGGPRRLLLVRPSERDALETLREEGFDGWLVAPLRRESLLSALRGEFAGAPVGKAGHPDLDRILPREKDSRLLNILVAEDNPVNALLLTNVLRKEGHSVTLVENGRALLDAALSPGEDSWPFDLVVTDLSMPVMDGTEAIGRLRAHQNEAGRPHLPIVVLSADGQVETREEARRIGADLYLEKPVDPAALLTIVERYAG